MRRATPRYCPKVVRHKNIDIFADVLADVLFESSRSHVLSMEEAQFALSLSDADDHFLIGRSASGFAVSASTDIGFIYFDNALEFLAIDFDHCGADSVAEIPRGLVGLDSERPLNLTGGHALLGLAEKERGKEPSHKGQVRVMEDGVHGDAELVLA